MTDNNTEIAKIEQNNAKVHDLFRRMEGELEKALADRMDRDHFVRLCMTARKQGGERMAKADAGSFVLACLEAAQLGLRPGGVTGECYLIPRWNKNLRGYAVEFQIGYKGLVKLVRRGNDVTEIAAEIVYGNDEFDVSMGTERFVRHKPWYVRTDPTTGELYTEPGPPIASYATARMRDGVAFRVCPMPEIRKAEAASGNPKDDDPSNVWRKYWEAMARKTAVLRLCKLLPMPDDAKDAINRDELRSEGIEAPPAIEMPTISQGTENPSSLDDLIGGPLDVEYDEAEPAENA